MVSTEPELDAQGRPRHDDPRDFTPPPGPGRRRNWLPWILAALVVLGLLLFVPPWLSQRDSVAPRGEPVTAPPAEGSAAAR
jgi:hypothetical protein